jgi:membrane protease YdiL (CAAX protease family)
MPTATVVNQSVVSPFLFIYLLVIFIPLSEEQKYQ